MADDLEDLVMELSTTLLGVRGDDLSETISSSLGRLGEVLGADRSYVLKTSVEGRSAGEAFEEWWRPGVERAVAADARTLQRMRTVGELLVGSIERCHADAGGSGTARKGASMLP